MEEKNYLVDGKLPKRIVQVKPIQENPGWVKDPRHVAFFKLENTFDRLMLPTQKKGVFMNALTKAEKKLLEEKMGNSIDLGVYKRDGKPSFWGSFYVKLDKYGLRLDLSDPMDYISFKVLLMNASIVAESYEARLTKATFRYYISDGKAEAAETKKKVNLNTKAYTAFGALAQSKTKLAAFLKVHNLVTKNSAINIDPNSDIEFLTEQVSQILEESPKRFLEFVDDPMFEIRLLLSEALGKGAIRRTPDAGYSTLDGVNLGRNLTSAVAFLNMDANQDVLLGIQAKVKLK